MTSITSDTPENRKLPTRVGKACERCRRNKSRCDPFRPCSLCVRANVECTSGSTDSGDASSAPTRKRTGNAAYDDSQRPHQRPRRSNEARSVTPNLFRPEEQHAVHRHDVSGSSRVPVADDVHATVETESRRQSVGDGEADSAVGIAHKIYQLSNQGMLEGTTSAIPGGNIYGKGAAPRPDRTQRRPVQSIIGFHLPPLDLMCTLLEEYFDSVHWFSLVVYEPRFRSKFESMHDGLASPSQKPFLLLLSTVLGMGAWYKSHKNRVDPDYPDEDWHAWASSLIQGAGSQLTDLMDHISISSVQACILLGSYYLYHGKPNLSFALLGATTKTAQVLALHRQPLRGDAESIEERKRVWWTIYTWDRFASITYGRPLGINDKDCNVTQPLDAPECPYFRSNGPSWEEPSIYYSAYQRELNKLYLIASPIIETVFGLQTVASNERMTGQQYSTQIMEVTERLWTWRRNLPAHLLLNLGSDCEPNQSNASRVHRLQALALQLTFDNLLIIFHRPLLAQQVDHLIKNQPEGGQGAAHSPASLSYAAVSSPFRAQTVESPLSRSQSSSTEQWWDAALRTSKVTEMPQLAQLATDTHLVAFLAINLFHSAIVMAVLALSDPLSDRAQEVKRTITRIFRLQELLGKKTKLSMQSNIILKDVIHMLLRREADAMLAPVAAPQVQPAGDAQKDPTPSDAPLMSVEDTLRLPMQPPLGVVNGGPHAQQQSSVDRVSRLNESLASLQRVFPLGSDGPYGHSVSNNHGWSNSQEDATHLPISNNNTWLQGGSPSADVDGGSGWFNEELDSAVDATGNGLYWFWDSTWTEARP
ncbi:fungal-specific transcription factor domain-containing protein [Coniochaeta sp. 2T2.1]|nr:fungal-specific transcription factor domain-containing protein [Coniochaeta sp. 2T2.1]